MSSPSTDPSEIPTDLEQNEEPSVITQVEGVFTTKLPEQYHIPDDPIVLEGSLSRSGLSSMLNDLLSLDEPAVFDFIVNGQFLRTSLADFYSQNGLSSEVACKIEYVLAMPEPETSEVTQEEEWLSCVEIVGGADSRFYATGSMKGSWSLYAGEGHHKLFGQRDSDASVLSLAGLDDVIATGSRDGLVRFYSLADNKKSSKLMSSANNGIKGGIAAVTALTISSDGSIVVAGDAGGLLALYNVPSDSSRDITGPRAVFADHHMEDCGVTRLVKLDAETVMSSSLDNTLALWDILAVKRKAVLPCARAATALAVSNNKKVVCTGHDDGRVAYWDLRTAREELELIQQYRTHERLITGVSWNPSSAYLVATSSLDGTVRLYDSRSARLPLQRCDMPQDVAVTGCAWLDDKVILSSGSDGKYYRDMAREWDEDFECAFDETDVIVLDSGSGFTKAGFSGCEVPARVVPTIAFHDTIPRGDSFDANVGVSAHTNISSRASTANDQRVKLYGNDALEAFTSSNQAQPIRPVLRGEIVDKEDLEGLWSHILKKIVRGSKWGRDGEVSLEGFPVLLADCPSSSAVATASNQPLVGVGGNSFTRAWMAEVMFEKFRAPAVAVVNTAALSLFSTGVPTGLVIDIGEGVTHATPVFQGFAIPHATFRLDRAGMDVTEHLRHLISQRQPALAEKVGKISKPGGDYLIYTDMKERFCRVRMARHNGQEGNSQKTDMSPTTDSLLGSNAGHFELPDGSVVQIDGQSCTEAPEILFDTEDSLQTENDVIFNSRGGGSLTQLCQAVLHAVDPEIVPDLLDNIYVSGGSAMLPGIAQRLENDLNALGFSHDHKPVKVKLDSQRRSQSSPLFCKMTLMGKRFKVRRLGSLSEYVAAMGEEYPKTAWNVGGIIELEPSVVPVSRRELASTLKTHLVCKRTAFRSRLCCSEKARLGVEHHYWMEDLGEAFDPIDVITEVDGDSVYPTFSDRGSVTPVEAMLENCVQDSFDRSLPPWRVFMVHERLLEHGRVATRTTLVFKLHHVLGDGFSLMNALLDTTTCLDKNSHHPNQVRFCSAIPLDRVKLLCNSLHVTVNDFIIAIMAGASRRYLTSETKLPKAEIDRLDLELGFTANLRTGSKIFAKQRNYSIMFGIPLPVAEPHALDRIIAVQNATQRLKRSPLMIGAVLSYFALWACNWPLLRTLTITRLVGPKYKSGKSWSLSNVPGPRMQRVLCGRTVAALVGYMNNANGVVAVSYQNELRLSILTDKAHINADALRGYFEEEINSLLSLTPCNSPRD
ncbi:WD repeat-containing protein 12 [Perkinsus chesapeaki]|uniref:WD repeat-containing protein 12 n=1 Tax=Perkinsus chesapeaki TaxID=330153 RepID=A0A7J6N306_PERCH|nr:WD repeat-containing protein 12 [Perkinsus chesapeaki]